ncbi:hypothetical protein L6452_00962 [Arctium lappa]|uniref:Uncharacterized protein n=1 Tax=Arctium lappa TaxID=4217 RepID=A0ACB9FGC5_ARCLA|nr:hypothetical protein L6452_00962 [Arctium lappa]
MVLETSIPSEWSEEEDISDDEWCVEESFFEEKNYGKERNDLNGAAKESRTEKKVKCKVSEGEDDQEEDMASQDSTENSTLAPEGKDEGQKSPKRTTGENWAKEKILNNGSEAKFDPEKVNGPQFKEQNGSGQVDEVANKAQVQIPRPLSLIDQGTIR